MRPEEITKEWLNEKYNIENLSAIQIITKYKLKASTKVIMEKLEEFGIPRKKKGRGSDSTTSTSQSSQLKEKEVKIQEEPISFFIGEEEFKVRDRVRLGETINGVKESNLCEITNIHKTQSGEIKVDLLTVMNHQKLTVLTSKLTLV